MRREASVNRTFRISTDIDNVLTYWAEKEGISKNSLLNRLLLKYLDFDAFATRLNLVTMTSKAAKKLMDYLSDEEVRDFGRWIGEKELREIILFRYRKMDLDTVLRIIRNIGSEGGHYQYDEQIDNSSRTVILRHGRGPKWSLFYEEAYKQLFKEFSEIQVETRRSDDQLLIQSPC